MYKLIGKTARLFGEFKGKKRITRALLAPFATTARDIEIKGHFGCTYLLPNIQESVAFELFVNGIYERETHEFLLDSLPKKGIFFDIGANIGSVAIPLCRQRPDIRCICVEASSWVYRYLVENISKNELSTMITGINKAVSDKNGDIVSFYSDEKVFGKGSMSPVFSNKDTKVETITIDHLVDRFDFSRVDVIKIDIEGFEFFAFKGGGKLLEGNNAPMILFEFVDWAERHAGIAPGEAQRFLITKGYMLYQLLLDGSLQIQESILENGTAMFIASKKKLL